VQVTDNSKKVYIRKSTTIWLFQKCECVFSDCLFRVRAKQPHSSESEFNLPKIKHMETLPQTLNVRR